MRTELSMLCRTAGQLGVVASAAATVASYSTLLPASGEIYIPPGLLASDLLDLLAVPVSLFVAWASCHSHCPQRGRQLTLAGCAVLATLVLARMAVLQSWTGLYSLWGASYLLSTAAFELSSIGLLAASYHRESRSESGKESGSESIGELGGFNPGRRCAGSSWMWQITLALVGVGTLCEWTGRVPSISLLTVVAACALYTEQRYLRPATVRAPWVPVAAILLGLASLHHGLHLALVALGPLPVISAYEAITTGVCALAALGLGAARFARAHRTRSVARTGPAPPATSPTPVRAACTPGRFAAQQPEGRQNP